MPEQTTAQKIVGTFAPKLAEVTDDVLFADIWERPELSPRDRSLITVAALVMGGNTEQLAGHVARALRNGVTEAELGETMTHLAFYAGWPKALSSIRVARTVIEDAAPHRDTLHDHSSAPAAVIPHSN